MHLLPKANFQRTILECITQINNSDNKSMIIRYRLFCIQNFIPFEKIQKLSC